VEIASKIEKLGGCLALDADGDIRFRIPKCSPEAKKLIEVARIEKETIRAYLMANHLKEQHSIMKNLAPCGSSYCAGCYDVGDGRKIHPPKCGEEFLRWRAWQEGKGARQ
jgi:hypothetical protein